MSTTWGRVAASLVLAVAVASELRADDAEAELTAAIARKDPVAALSAARSAVVAREAAHSGDPRAFAATLDELAGRLGPLQGPEAASFIESLHERSLRLQEAVVGARSFSLVGTLDRLSEHHYNEGHWAECEAIDRRVLELRLAEQGEDHPEVAQARRNLALDLYREGRFGEQEPYLRAAVVSLERITPQPSGQLGDAVGELAECLRAQARYAEAEPLFVRALDIGASARATVLSNLSGLYRDQNRYGEALWRQSQALEIEASSPEPNRTRLVALWNNMAELYRFQGDMKEAERYYVKAVDGARLALGPGHSRLGTLLNQLAELYRETGRLSGAETLYREALAIKTGALGADHPDVAHTEEGFGRLLAASGRPEEAEIAFRQALRIREARLGPGHPDLAETRVALAEFLEDRPGRRTEACTLLDAAISALDSTTADPRSLAQALSVRASMKRRGGDRTGAREDLERSLRLVERLRPEAGGGEQTRARFGSRYAADFARLAGWLVEDGDLDGAFRAAERSRARALLDQLDSAHVLIEAIEPEERARFSKREAEVLSRLAADRGRLQQVDASAASSDAERAALAERIGAAQAEYQRLYEDIRNASRLWRGFGSSHEPVGIADAQRRAVPSRGVLLSYLVSDERALLFVVPPSGAAAAVHCLEVSPKAGQVLGVAPGLLTGSTLRRMLAPESVDPTAADGLLTRLGRPPMQGRERPALHRQLHALFETLVPAAVWHRLRSSREVVVVPDHLLHRLPFEALVVGLEPGTTRFWIDQGPAIRYAPSATTLLALSDRAASANRRLVSVADPVYDTQEGSDPAKDAPARPQVPTQAAPLLRGGLSLSRLPGTAREAAAIRAAFAAQGLGGRVTSLEAGEAREPRVRALLPEGRYLHLATHGLVDDGGTELFATLALTPPPSLIGPEDDGLLQMHEILALRLDADLTVLSACESRIGSIVAGEGVFALSRAFLIAGARRAVASLWPVEDSSTAALFGALFRDVARADANDRRPDYPVALARAKRMLRGQPATADPFFWAPFVLEGMP